MGSSSESLGALADASSELRGLGRPLSRVRPAAPRAVRGPVPPQIQTWLPEGQTRTRRAARDPPVDTRLFTKVLLRPVPRWSAARGVPALDARMLGRDPRVV